MIRSILFALLLLPMLASAQYTYVAAGTLSQNPTAAPGQPAGKAAGDLLLLCTGARNTSETLNADPTGWTLLHDSSGTGNTSLALYGRIATDDANDDVSHDFWSGGSGTTSQIAAFSGDVFTTLGTIVVHSAAQNDTSTNDIPTPAMTITTDNTLVVACVKKGKTATSDGDTVNAAPSWSPTQIGFSWVDGNSLGFIWGYQIQTTASSLASSLWDMTTDETVASAAIIVSLQQAASSSLLLRRRR